MTSPGQFAAQDGSFARSAGGAAGRGIILIVVAVGIGLFLLAKGFDGGGPSLIVPSSANEASDEPATDNGEPADADSDDVSDGGTSDAPTDGSDNPPATVDEPNTTRPPGEVKVAAVNTTGEPGLASTATGKLDTQGYVTAAKNGVQSDTSGVYYLAGYSEDAKEVAKILGIPADLIFATEAADILGRVLNDDNVTDFHIFIIQGTDRLAG